MLKAYKYRIYPNSEQRIQIAKTFGCCRFVYNQTLAYRKEIYEKEKKSVSKTDCNNYCNRELKKDYEWLKEVDKFALTNAIYNMDTAYQKFFKEHAGFPKFKSKHDNHKSYKTNYTNGNITVNYEKGKIKLPKLKEVKARLHRNYSGQIKSATVSQMPSGKYYVGLVAMTKVVNRFALATGAIFLILCGLCPKLAALVSIMPQSVLGGAAVMMFSSIVISGIQLITKNPLTARNLSIVSVALGVGYGMGANTGILANAPQFIQLIFGGSGIVPAAMVAILLNIVLPKED